MKVMFKQLNLLEDKEIIEQASLPVIVPDTEMEADFLLSWISHELREDLGDIPPEQYDQISHFYKTINRIVHSGQGRFYFDPTNKGSGFTNMDISFFIHRFRDDDTDGEPENVFELIWELGGVAQSLFESSVIDEMMKSIK